MFNCALAQIGITFNLDSLLEYSKTSMFNQPEHNLTSVFGIKELNSDQHYSSPLTSSLSSNLCSLITEANICIPIKAVCYHYNLTASMLNNKLDAQQNSLPSLDSNNPINNEDDEYAAMKILS